MNLSLVRKPSAVYAQTYSEPEKENKEGESPGFLILKQRAVACELYASDKGWPQSSMRQPGTQGMRSSALCMLTLWNFSTNEKDT